MILPFIQIFTPKINKILFAHNMIPINKTINKFNNMITLGKYRLDKLDSDGIMYKIDCQNCSFNFIGMIQRKWKMNTIEQSNKVWTNRRHQFERTYFVESFGLDLFRESVWKGIISGKRLERNYFANAFGKDIFCESVWKSLIPKTNFRKSLYYIFFERVQISLRKLVLE